MMKFRVWFDQVNQVIYEVKAKDRDEAEKKAIRLWNSENKSPSASYIEEVTDDTNRRNSEDSDGRDKGNL